MRTRTTIVMAAMLVVAGVFAWIDTPATPSRFGADGIGRNPGAAPRPGEEIVHLLDFSSAAIVRIVLQRSGVTATLTRTPDGWSGISDANAVEEFLQNMRALAKIIVVGRDQGGPQAFGLDPPVARVTLERAAAEPIELRIGNANPTSTGIYAQVGADGPVVLTGALALWDLDKIVRILQSAHTPGQPTSAVKETPS
jgi:hypothetical protein